MMKALRDARETLAWRDEAHTHGRQTNLDEVPALAVYVIHLLWAAQRRRSAA